jgi:2-keto-3-deoxy-6-phosphogluconate aldolase
VVRPEQVDLAVEAGARFIVTPAQPRVVERCRELDILVI